MTGASKLDSERYTGATLGMFWMFVTGLCFVCVTVIVRYIGTRVPAAEAAFLRYAFGVVLIAPVIANIVRGKLQVKSWRMMVLRGLAHGGGVMLWFFAMARIPIAEVTALGYLSPVIVTLAAAIFLGEKLHARRIVAVVVGFIGVMIIVRPGFTGISIGQLAQLGATPLFAASFICAKILSKDEDLTVIVATLTVMCTLTLLVPALHNWVQPSLVEVSLLALTAVFATAGHWTMTKAFSLAPLAVVQPISFLQLLWATVLGILLFGEPVDIYVVTGGAILVLSTTYIAHRESVVSRREREGESSE